MEYVILLDDDVILERDYCCELVHTLERNRTIAGVGGWITNPQEAPGEAWLRWLLRFFMIYGNSPGEILPSGFNTPMFVGRSKAPFRSECLEGGNSCFRRSMLQGIWFDATFERFAGYAYAEDIDFSYAVGRRGQLLINPNARMVHSVSPAGRTNDFRFGMCQVTNRALFVIKHWGDRYHFACFLWSMLGIMALNIGMLAAGRSPKRLLGNIVGLVLVLTGQIRPQPQP
jgi:GT2 family glycosyltransferase